VVAPEGVSINSVAALPGGGFVITNFQMAAGELWEWQPGDGWERVPGSEMAGPNGIVASDDGRWLYIGGWATQSLIRLSRGQTPPQISSVDVGHHVDNVRWATDGSLLAAGHVGETPTAIFQCLGQGQGCDGVSSMVTRVDPELLTAREIIRYPSNDLLILGTVAIEVGDEIWVGGIAGGTRIARFARR
jgi:sugar lactone lactonase YvrE